MIRVHALSELAARVRIMNAWAARITALLYLCLAAGLYKASAAATPSLTKAQTAAVMSVVNTLILSPGSSPAAIPAVTGLQAVATMEGAILTFAAPLSNGGAALTGYIATATPGGATASISAITSPVNGLSARIYFPGLNAGTSYTFTVRAENANGLGVVSTASNAVTPTAYAPFYVLNGSEAPRWSNYNYGGTFTPGVAPGTILSTNLSGVRAPANWSGGTGVYEVDISSAYGAALPYVEHTNPSNTGNGRFSLEPFTNVVIQIFPAASGQVVNTYFYHSIWLNGVASAAGSTSGSTSVLTDATQNWVANQFQNGWALNDNTIGIVQNAVDGNTATTVTYNISGVQIQEGDFYELQQPDQGIGNSITLPNSAYGPGTMTAGQVNTWTIPISAFGVMGQEILKLGIQDQTGGSQQTWWVSYAFE